MKTKSAYLILFSYLVFGLLMNLMIIKSVYGFSTYGAPAEFGNATNTTCFIGGDYGILNCTGNITAPFFKGNGSLLKGITTISAQDLSCSNCIGTPEIADVYLQLIGGTMLGNIYSPDYNITAAYISGNGSNITNVNASFINCNDIEFSGTVGSATICDGDDAFGSGAGQGMWEDIGTYLQPNSTFATNVNITGDLKIQGTGDFSCSSCINPADINDVDDEDIESDLNTYVDIPGDNMTGPLIVFSSISADNWLNVSITESQISDLSHYGSSDFNTNYESKSYYKKANLTIDYPNLDTDSTNDVTAVTGASPISSTEGTTPSISISQSGSASHGYLSSTDWNTFNNKVNASEVIDDITEWDSLCTDCVGTDDVATGACDNNCLIASPTFTSPVIATNIAADGSGGANLGTSSTEWGNIYIATNSKIYLGDGSEGQIYFDGSRLVIKVTS